MDSVDINNYNTDTENSRSDIVVETNNHKMPLNAKKDVNKSENSKI